MKNQTFSNDESKPLVVRRGRVESVDLYEIKDSELETLEKGTPAELQLNFAIFLISLAFGAISSLLTATFPNEVTQTVYIIISVVGTLGGVYLVIAWWRTRSEVQQLCKRIKERIPPASCCTADEQDGIGAIDDPENAPAPQG